LREPRGKNQRIPGWVALLCAFLITLIPAQASPSWLKTEITSGYDSFIDRFTIAEEDTFDVINDFYLGVANRVSSESSKIRFSLNNSFKYGYQTIDESLDFLLSSRPLKTIRVDFRNNFTLKKFQPGSEYTMSNDYNQLNSSINIKKTMGKNRLLLKSRLEVLRFADRNEFDYNYNYVDAGLGFERSSSFKNHLHISGYTGYRSAPDTTELNYRRYLAIFEASSSFDNLAIRFSSSADRKKYLGTTRSPYWYIVSILEFEISSPSNSYALVVESEHTSYDNESEIYIGTHFLRGGIRYRHRLGNLSSFYIEPRVARMFCDSSREERYIEGSIVLGLDLFENKWFWLTTSYEPGYRHYLLKDNPIYSDFTINRISVIGSIHMSHSFSLDLFISHEPEKHSRREDDFSISLISLELKKGF